MISIITSILLLCIIITGLIYAITKTMNPSKQLNRKHHIRTVDTSYCKNADPQAYEFVDNEDTTLLLVHLGANMPYHLYDHIEQIRFMSPRTRIIIALNNEQLVQTVKHIEGVEIYNYQKPYQVSEELSGHYVFHTSLERFIVLEDMMKTLSLTTVFHMEHDNTLYMPLSYIKQQCDTIMPNKIGIPRDSKERCIPSLMYIGSINALQKYTQFIREQNFKCIDMQSWCQFLIKYPEYGQAFSVVPKNHPKSNMLHCKKFKGIVDAAAMGQFIGGVDTIHNFGNTKGFINETSEYTAEECEPVWSWDKQERRVPLICYKNKYHRLYNLHMHCKRLHEVLSAPVIRAADIIQGEKFQSLADVQFVDEDLIATQDWPTDSFIAYTHTHLLELFFEHQWPKRETPFVLITHNSDHAITEDFIQYLNDDKLVKWYAQNVQITHPKLQPLPIGQANSKYEHGNTDDLVQEASKWRTKDKPLYVNFGDTHTYRKGVRQKIRSSIQEHVIKDGEDNYKSYLKSLAEHDGVACPYGNGADTHRFWETLYMGGNPLLYESELTEWTNPNPNYMFSPTPLGRRWWRFSFYKSLIESHRQQDDQFDLVLFARTSVWKETLDQCAYLARKHMKGINKIWYMGDEPFTTFYGEELELPNDWSLVHKNIVIQPPSLLWMRSFSPFKEGRPQWFESSGKSETTIMDNFIEDTPFKNHQYIPCKKNHMLLVMDELSKLDTGDESPPVLYDAISRKIRSTRPYSYDTIHTLKERKLHVHQKYHLSFLEKYRQCDYIMLQ